MELVQAFKCDVCGKVSGDQVVAATHEETCRQAAAIRQKRAEIKALEEDAARRLRELQGECKHPNETGRLIQNMPGVNYHMSCPDCGREHDNFDQT